MNFQHQFSECCKSMPDNKFTSETGDPPPRCKKGTYTNDDVRSLRKPEDCDVCPIGKYCTNGQITGELQIYRSAAYFQLNFFVNGSRELRQT